MSLESLTYRYRDIYYNFPQSLKTFLGELYGSIPLSVRFGKSYNIHTKILRKFENSNEQFKLDYMYNKTLETIIFAEENISYYQDIFNEFGISSNSFKSLGDIKQFPTLTKKIIKKNINGLYSDKGEKPIVYYSGGSLSRPAKYFLPNSSRAKEKAYNDYIFSKIGYKNRDKTLLLKGRDIAKFKENIFWEYEPVNNDLLLSSNYMNSDKFPLMYKKVKEFTPKFLFGYPSAVLSFIKQSKLYKFEKLDIKGVMLASETVYPDELKMIQEYFEVDVLTHYGHTERNAIGYRINRDEYNIMNSYGLVRANNSELITTSFDNFVMPFINYKTGDSVAGNITNYDSTDVVKKVENIEGRTQDFLVTKDKRLVSVSTMCYNQDRRFEDATAIQYIQNKIGEVVLLIEGKDINAVELERDLNNNPMHRGLTIKIKKVNEIPKTHRGKRVMCKQSLDIETFRN